MLYFVRHGQTDYNVEQRFAGGDVEARLTDTGRAQATHFAQKNVSHLADIELLIVSPQERAQETANLIRPFCAPNVRLETEEGLREWILGTWSGQPYDNVPYLFSDPPPDPEGGEPYETFAARVLTTLSSIARRPEPKILLVSHGAVWFAYARHTQNPRHDIENCELQTLERRHLTFPDGVRLHVGGNALGAESAAMDRKPEIL